MPVVFQNKSLLSNRFKTKTTTTQTNQPNKKPTKTQPIFPFATSQTIKEMEKTKLRAFQKKFSLFTALR